MLNRSFVKIQHAKNQIQIKEYLKTEDNYYISHECFCDILIIYSMKNDINIFITADIIWFSNSTVRKVKKFILRFLSIKEKNIVLAASHTHGTPNPEEAISFPIFSRKFDNHILNCIKKTFKKFLIYLIYEGLMYIGFKGILCHTSPQLFLINIYL